MGDSWHRRLLAGYIVGEARHTQRPVFKLLGARYSNHHCDDLYRKHRGRARRCVGLAARDFLTPSALWTYATGIALTIAVVLLFRALSLGPASVVVPIYGMVIVGGAFLGMVFLDEPPTLRRLAGIALAVVSVFLIAAGTHRRH